MVAHYIRLMLVLELAAYVAISAWLHFLWGWSYAALALGLRRDLGLAAFPLGLELRGARARRRGRRAGGTPRDGLRHHLRRSRRGRAAQLDREIERIAAGTGREKLVLVCHSMGGLAARAYLCGHGADRVAKLITIASPHHGTLHALFAAGANARQMHRGSRFLAEICANEAERAPQCGVTSIYSPHDNLVAPQETSRLAWAKNIAIPGFGHLDMLRSRRLFEVVLEELREAGVEARA
jgi:predicted alpha/beta hydrolase family esterase